MGTIIDLMRERIEELERIRNGNKIASTAEEENISIDGSLYDQENKGKGLEIRRRRKIKKNMFRPAQFQTRET